MGEKLVRRLGMTVTANAYPALRQRLIAAGLFGELDELRWAGHPYLPKAEFIPGGRELAQQDVDDRLVAEPEQRLRHGEGVGGRPGAQPAGEDHGAPERGLGARHAARPGPQALWKSVKRTNAR